MRTLVRAEEAKIKTDGSKELAIEKEWDIIVDAIEFCIVDNMYSTIIPVVHPENVAKLRELGYYVSRYYTQISATAIAYEVSWEYASQSDNNNYDSKDLEEAIDATFG